MSSKLRNEAINNILDEVNNFIIENIGSKESTELISKLKAIRELDWLETSEQMKEIFEKYKEEYLEDIESIIDSSIEDIENLGSNFSADIESLNELKESLFENFENCIEYESVVEFLSETTKDFYKGFRRKVEYKLEDSCHSELKDLWKLEPQVVDLKVQFGDKIEDKIRRYILAKKLLIHK